MGRISGALDALNKRVEAFARKPHANWFLCGITFIESSILPIPPDPLLIVLSVSNPRKSFLYGLICIAGSVAGSLAGYFIGHELFETVGSGLLEFFGATDEFLVVAEGFRDHVWLTMLVAGFVPVPYHVFTMAAGFTQAIDPLTFVLASLCGRTLRFFTVSALLFFLGGKLREFTGRHAMSLMLVPAILLVVGVAVAKWIF